MAKIDTSPKTISDILKRYPEIKFAADAARVNCEKTREAANLLWLNAIQASFRVRYLAETINRCGQGGYFSFMVEKYSNISRRTAFRYLHAARHLMENCPCLKGLDVSEINKRLDEEGFVEKIFAETMECLPQLSLTDLYRKELPEPKEKRKPFVLPHETQVFIWKAAYESAQQTITDWTAEEPRNQVWRNFEPEEIRELAEGFRTLSEEMENALNMKDGDNGQ